MREDLKVIYLLDDVEIKQYMTQQQLAELLKNDDVLLLSINSPTVRQYRKKKNNKR